MFLRLANLYLLAAAFWAALGVTLLATGWGWVIPLGPNRTLPVAYIALALAAYNLLRWWLTSSAELVLPLQRRCGVGEGSESGQ
jgi:hypothetical protein